MFRFTLPAELCTWRAGGDVRNVRNRPALASSRKAKPLTPYCSNPSFLLSFTTLPSGLILWTKRMGKCICTKNTLLHLDPRLTKSAIQKALPAKLCFF